MARGEVRDNYDAPGRWVKINDSRYSFREAGRLGAHTGEADQSSTLARFSDGAPGISYTRT